MKNSIQATGSRLLNPFAKTLYGCVTLFIVLIMSCSSNSQIDDQENIVAPSNEDDKTFEIAVLPDTQYYTAEKHGGTIAMFSNQIDWIIKNAVDSNIKYVIHLGDVVDHGHEQMTEWTTARDIMYKLENSFQGYPEGIPYGIAVGNHDQQPYGEPSGVSTVDGYNNYFGIHHFSSKTYYGGSFGDNNDNHYGLFEAHGQKFIVLFIEYNEFGTEYYNSPIENAVFEWGKKVLNKYADHKAIIVSHSILARPEGSTSITRPGEGSNLQPSTFTNQGEKIYNGFKDCPTIFMMLSGHRSGEGFRIDTYNGRSIKSFLSDYQSREDKAGNRNGGGGLMRTMKFNLTKNTITIKTFAPRSTFIESENDGDSFFSTPLFN